MITMHHTNSEDCTPPEPLTTPPIKQPITPPNNHFYMSSADAGQIMNPSCFSQEVLDFLKDEKECLRKIFLQERYECIIEVGCHAGQNASWLAELCSHYIGLDINAEAIDLACATKQVPGKIDFLCKPVENLIPLLEPIRKYPERTVVLFPFNLLGNFINVEELIAIFDMTGVDLAMSNFNTDSATTIGRYNYYANCFGKPSIRVYDAAQGVLFKAGQHFQSIAYHQEYLTRITHENSKYHGVLMPFSSYGYLFFLTN